MNFLCLYIDVYGYFYLDFDYYDWGILFIRVRYKILFFLIVCDKILKCIYVL